ncbi:Crp/Fnr family transcriptional regulator [Rhizobium sp. RU20A]|uniref:Crp/Fnr family transcriptional regulator n=1 Tax=Rhizobium sp. RU20A TaxID=1907412 RepID=UPI001FCEAF7C|nr:Crp/Fnr family transcriptional regulator [Rhizobium sp. RU20A]
MKCQLFGGVRPETAARLLDGALVSSHEAGDILFREGEGIDSLMVVLNGLVRVYRSGREGREADLGVFTAGDVFGECAILSRGRVAGAHGQALEPSLIAHIDMHRARQMLAEDPSFASAVMTLLCQRLHDLQDSLAEDRLLTAHQRVAHYLLRHCPEGQAPVSFRLPFQKSVLAGKLGLAPEALSRAFSHLRQRGVVVRGRVIEVHDKDALREA